MLEILNFKDKTLNSEKVLHQVCHFEEREISTSSSTKIGDLDCRVSCGDFSFLEMTILKICCVILYCVKMTKNAGKI